jgi:hypothetical protein
VGAQRWASPTGSGTACSQASPCDLDTAVEDVAVIDGDEVIVMPGSYSVVTLSISAAIDLHGQNGQPAPTINVTGGLGVDVGAAATVHDLVVSPAPSRAPRSSWRRAA